MAIVKNVSKIEENAKTTKELFEKYDDIVKKDYLADSDVKRLNGNINDDTPCGKLSGFATESSKIYASKNLVSPKFAKAHADGDIHIHDLDYYATKTTTCLQIPLGEMLENGIWNEHGFLRPPKTITTASALAAIIMQSSQNQFHGGQSYPSFDFDLAPYVKKSYERNYDKIFSQAQGFVEGIFDVKKLEKVAWEETETETMQAMEGFVHNLNTMHSRAGAQVIFSSINFGLDTSREGRLVSKCLMQAQLNGLGKGETPIFPILIVKVKDGVNYKESDPNYDLLQMSIKVTSKRLFSNWLFLDAPYNKALYDITGPEKSVSTMGCAQGDETITYRIKQRNGSYFYYENVPIKTAYNHISQIERNK